MSLEKFKKQLRKSQTKPEDIFWFHLRSRRFQGFKFRRQHCLKNYIVDFVCLEKNIIIELDGGQHAQQKEYDQRRTEVLEAEGFRVYRFWNNEIFNNLDGVLGYLYKEIHGNENEK